MCHHKIWLKATRICKLHFAQTLTFSVQVLNESFTLQDHIIIELTKTGLKKVADGEEPVMEEDPFLVVNPNYVLED